MTAWIFAMANGRNQNQLYQFPLEFDRDFIRCLLKKALGIGFWMNGFFLFTDVRIAREKVVVGMPCGGYSND